jgi:dTDP-4-amino-4,6-dideoxygalactose transaminase
VSNNIPLVDLGRQHAEVADAVREGMDRVISRTAFVLGPEVAEFEQAYATFSGVQHCIGVANGTDALELALRAVGVGSGHEVVVPANSFVASALAVVRAGGRPVFVDSDPDTHLIDTTAVEGVLSDATRAVMPVHLYGQVAPVELIEPFIAGRDIAIVEDAAQAQGAIRNGVGAGGLGAIGGTSFYPGKNLGAYGDAGAVVTNSDALAKRVRALRNYGGEVKYLHPEVGFNSRLDTMQAVVLSAKLARLGGWNDARRKAAALYDELLADVPGVRPSLTLPGNEHVFHLYVIRVADRDEVLARLQAAGIGAGIHYPVPIHLQGAFADLGHREGDFPHAEAAAREVLSLPIFPGITGDEQERVVAELRRALR